MLALISCTKDRILKANSDENHLSNGSIVIYAGIEEHRSRVAILWVVGWHVDYFILTAPLLKRATETTIPLNEKYCFEPDSLRWTCAWTLTKTSGHELKPESDWLKTDEGLKRWQKSKRRYSHFIPLPEIKLPYPPGYELPEDEPDETPI